MKKQGTKYLVGGGLLVAGTLAWLLWFGWPEVGDGGLGKRSSQARLIGVGLLAAWCFTYGLVLRATGE